MSALSVYQEEQPQQKTTYFDFDDIQQQLASLGVRFERWNAAFPLADTADQDTVFSAYKQSIEQLKKEYGFQSVDLISMNAGHPDKEALRTKFLSEHVHEDFEVRFFIKGRGLFCLHVDDKVYAMLCEQGDLISVPAGTRHWFDMGELPDFKCIRLFTTQEGWVAQFTGDPIAAQFPTLDQFAAELS